MLRKRWPKVKAGWLQPDTGTLIKCGPNSPEVGELVFRRITYDEACEITKADILKAFETVCHPESGNKICYTHIRHRQMMTGSHPWVFSMTISSVWNITLNYSKPSYQSCQKQAADSRKSRPEKLDDKPNVRKTRLNSNFNSKSRNVQRYSTNGSDVLRIRGYICHC
jgi:hypothetical protein